MTLQDTIKRFREQFSVIVIKNAFGEDQHIGVVSKDHEENMISFLESEIKTALMSVVPEKEDVENIKCPEGANIGELRRCEKLRREGKNEAIDQFTQNINNYLK